MKCVLLLAVNIDDSDTEEENVEEAPTAGGEPDAKASVASASGGEPGAKT